MKIYRRNSDGFEVQDAKDRPIEWAVETYGGEFVEVLPPTPPTQEELDAIAADKAAKRATALAKLEALGLSEDDLKLLIGG